MDFSRSDAKNSVTNNSETEFLFRNMVEEAPVAMCVFCGKDFIIETANKSMIEFWGRSSEDVLHKPLFSVVPEAKNQGYEELMLKVMTTGEPFFAKNLSVNLLRNGTVQEVFINFSYKPIRKKDGSIFGILAVAVDVTEEIEERKKIKAEKNENEKQKRLYEAIANNTPDLLYIFDLNYRFIYANEALLKMWGKTWEESNGKGLLEIGYEPWHAEMHEREIDQIIATKNSVRGIVSFPHAVFGKRVYDYLLVPVFNRNGEVEAIAGNTRDITDIKNAEELLEKKVKERTKELEYLNDELQHINQNLEEFVYAASHDLKEPVRKISLFASRLKEDLETKLNATQLNLFERLDRSSKRMGLLIDDLLTYSHLTRESSFLEEVDINKKIENALEDLEMEIEEKKGVVTFDRMPVIQGHKRQIQQLFQNLISNGLKYSKTNISPVIHIGYRQVNNTEIPFDIKVNHSGRLFHLIEVTDNGIGFAPEFSDRIFNLFTRLHGSSEYQGTGIGLSIAKKVVQNHKGFIWAESNIGEGAKFKILLPAVV